MAATPPPTTASSNFQSASNSFNALPLAGEKYGTDAGREGKPCGNSHSSAEGLLVPLELLSYRNARDCAKSRARRMHRIAQHANTRHGDFHGVSRNERADSRGCAAGNQVAGEQGHHARNPADQEGYGIDHEGGVARLAAFAIDVGLDQDVARIELRFDMRSGGAKRVKALGASELHIALLEIARGNIVHAGVAQDVGKWIVIIAEMRALLADHDAQLAFVLDAIGVARQDDGLLRADYGRGGFQKDERLFGNFIAKFGGVRSVVTSNADNLGRLDGRE